MVFGVRHLSEKECSRGVLAAILGSSAWVHVPRAVLAVVRDDEDRTLARPVRRREPASPRHPGPHVPDRRREAPRGSRTRSRAPSWMGDSTKDVETMLGRARKPPSRSADGTGADPRHPRRRGRAGVRRVRRASRARVRAHREDCPERPGRPEERGARQGVPGEGRGRCHPALAHRANTGTARMSPVPVSEKSATGTVARARGNTPVTGTGLFKPNPRGVTRALDAQKPPSARLLTSTRAREDSG